MSKHPAGLFADVTTAATTSDPSPWIMRFGHRIRSGGTVLDLACGGGRHSRHFAILGHAVTAVDIDTVKTRALATELDAENADAGPIEVITADLESGEWPLAGRSFDGIVVVNYLFRPHFPLLCDALAHGGVLLFDTFAAGNERHGRPRNPDHLLEPGELLRAFGERLQLVAYEHGELTEPHPAVRQSICAIRAPGPELRR